MPVLLTNEYTAPAPLVNAALLRRAAARLLILTELPEAELSILLVGDRRMAELNSSWRGKSGPTNVLAFALREGDETGMAEELLGDIVISVDTAAREAAEKHCRNHAPHVPH